MTYNATAFRGICTACIANYEVFNERCQIICGDGQFDPTEICDDGNTNNLDGCSNACLVNIGWNCDLAFPTTCYQCGNNNIDPLEACDDGDLVPTNGCDSAC